MSIGFRVYAASGQATCQICNKKIEIDVAQVNGFGYQTQGNCHLSCLVNLAKEKGLKWEK